MTTPQRARCPRQVSLLPPKLFWSWRHIPYKVVPAAHSCYSTIGERVLENSTEQPSSVPSSSGYHGRRVQFQLWSAGAEADFQSVLEDMRKHTSQNPAVRDPCSLDSSRKIHWMCDDLVPQFLPKLMLSCSGQCCTMRSEAFLDRLIKSSSGTECMSGVSKADIVARARAWRLLLIQGVAVLLSVHVYADERVELACGGHKGCGSLQCIKTQRWTSLIAAFILAQGTCGLQWSCRLL